MLVRGTKGNYFQAKRLDRKTPKDDNDCCWIHSRLHVRRARAKLFLSLCFRVLGSFSVYSLSSPGDNISTFSIQNAKSFWSFKRFLLFRRQTWKWLAFHGSHMHWNCSPLIYLTRSHYFSLADASAVQPQAEFNKPRSQFMPSHGNYYLSLVSLSLSVFGHNTHPKHHSVGRFQFTLWFLQKTRNHCFPMGLGRLEEAFGWWSN